MASSKTAIMNFSNKLDELYRQINKDDLKSFTIELCRNECFDFYLSDKWPFKDIIRTLEINSSLNSYEDAWQIFALSTKEFDLSYFVNGFSRDQYGSLIINESKDILAFYDSDINYIRIYDFSNRRAFFICDSNHSFADYEIHSPFREFWHYWALKNDALLIHSGIVANDSKAIMLPGPGGKGKSTTVLSCLNHNLQTTGDDYNIFYKDGDDLFVYPIYGNIKQKLNKNNEFDFNFPITQNWEKETLKSVNKVVFYPPSNSSIWIEYYKEIEIVGILCPEIFDSDTTIQEIKLIELVNNIAVSSIMHSPYMAKEYLSRIVSYIKYIKTGKILLSKDTKANAEFIKNWLLKE